MVSTQKKLRAVRCAVLFGPRQRSRVNVFVPVGLFVDGVSSAAVHSVLLQVPRLVSLLAESFNAHMRFGSCLAIGISCAGTGSREAMDVLEPMMEDAVDFVRQVWTD